MKLEKANHFFGNIFVQSIQKNAHQGRSVWYNTDVAYVVYGLCTGRRFNLAPEMG